MLSRLGTTAEASFVEDEDIPCFMVTNLEEETELLADGERHDILVTEQSEPPSGLFVPMSPEEMICEKQADPFCTQIHACLNGGQHILFEVNDQGYLVKFVGSQPQIVVPDSLQQ